MARASVFQTEGRGFDPHLPLHSQNRLCIIMNIENDNRFESEFIIIVEDCPDTISELSQLFREKRGYDPFFLYGSCDDELWSEADLADIESGEYSPEEPDYEEYCREIVECYKDWLIVLIVDDDTYEKELEGCFLPGQTIRQQGKLRSSIKDATRDPVISNN